MTTTERGTGDRVRLTELIAALSLASDLAIGEPMEHALRRCLIAVRLGRALGLAEDELTTIYDLALLRSIGCTAEQHELSRRFGNEQPLAHRYARTDFGRPREAIGFVVQAIGADDPLPRRARRVADAMVSGKRPWQALLAAHCEVAQGIAGRAGYSDQVMRALDHVFERWDGKGIPGENRGEEIERPARVVALASDLEVFHRDGGIDAAVMIARQRRGTAYDPALVDRFCRVAADVLVFSEHDSVWETALAAEPGPPRWLSGDRLDAATLAVAGFADLKSPYTIGHSSGVAALAESAARACRLNQDEIAAIRRAGLVHDLGRAALPTTIWEKRGPLSLGEWERVRLHPYYTERILARSPVLARYGAIAALHHERLDGSGYHRGASGSSIPPSARILAAADVYHALTEDRPHRPAHSPDAASDVVRDEARRGRLDPDAVSAVLAAAGHRAKPVRREWPAGLSDREVEVLRLLARGLPSRRIGEHLSISEKTVGHHISHIYEKLDVSTRAAATFFAMQYGLVNE
jgi:HD-GYP domain-containing protein (c-di-GMP phosphodiesterase class II)/DNA-binding CsgD family transcriptional regulator